MFCKKKEKRNYVDDEETLLEYLSSLNMEANNKTMLGINRYKQIDGWTPRRFVQTLCLLRDKGYVSLYFYGREDEEHACDVTMRERALTYFENQDAKHQEEQDEKMFTLYVAILSGVVSAVVSAIVSIAISLTQ